MRVCGFFDVLYYNMRTELVIKVPFKGIKAHWDI